MTNAKNAIGRAERFCNTYGLGVPVLMAPMAGACPASLAISASNAGGMAACGALLMQPEEIESWVREVRTGTNCGFQINLWIPDPAPKRDAAHEVKLRDFLAQWGPEVAADAADVALPDFGQQQEALLAANPTVISSIMGVYPVGFVIRMKERNIRWFANVTTVEEALIAQAAGADAIVAQGMEAGGHRGAFDADQAASKMVGLFSLLPAIVDAVELPVVATGGIGDARGVAAAMLLGASAVQVGTALLRAPEAGIAPAWADAIGRTRPEDTVATRAFSGRLGRAVRNEFAVSASAVCAPSPAPYPVQRGLTASMRAKAARSSDITRMQAWAGQSAAMAQPIPAKEIIAQLWNGAKQLLA